MDITQSPMVNLRGESSKTNIGACCCFSKFVSGSDYDSYQFPQRF